MMTTIDELQSWFAAECNGDWEHTFGVRLETLDNPGWLLTVDLEETRWEQLLVPRTIVERSEEDWLQYEVTQSKFIGSGGARNLNEVIAAFLKIVEANDGSV